MTRSRAGGWLWQSSDRDLKANLHDQAIALKTPRPITGSSQADGKSEFTLISLWDSWDAIKAFAGPEYENAVYYPEDEKFLVERGPRVMHYEVLSRPSQ